MASTAGSRRKPARRGPGRPEAGGVDVRAVLLDAALACFVREGIATTTLRQVAREAGVTAAMLHYYFGDRSALVRAVIDERVLPAFGSLQTRLAPGMAAAEPMTAIAAFVDAIDALVREHPWLPALWVREVLCEGGGLRGLLLQELAPQMRLLLPARLMRAFREGGLVDGIDPRLLVVSLVGLTLFPAAGAPIWRHLLDADDIDSDALRRHTLALLEHGVPARTAARKRRRR